MNVEPTSTVTSVSEGFRIIGNVLKPDSVVTLSHHAWSKLLTVRDEVHQCFLDSVHGEWSLETRETYDVRANVRVFNERPYVHFRVWSDAFPAKNDTVIHDWSRFMTLLRDDDTDSGFGEEENEDKDEDVDVDEDVKLGIEVYRIMLSEKVNGAIRCLCDGCVIGRSRPHAWCLMGWSSMTVKAVGGVSLSSAYFTLRLAQFAMDRSYVLRKVPREVVDDVVSQHDATICTALRESYGRGGFGGLVD